MKKGSDENLIDAEGFAAQIYLGEPRLASLERAGTLS